MTRKIGLVFVLVAIVLYLVTLVTLMIEQRRMMYLPSDAKGSAAFYGLSGAATLGLKTSDGETIVAWYQTAVVGKPLFLFFHGNGGNLGSCADLLRELSADGSGFLTIDYRGYGGSTGKPDEQGLLRDGEAAYAQAADLGYEPGRIVVVGESLGTGVAVAVAAGRPVQALVLDSAYSSTVDVAAARYWMFPVRLLMMDTFDSVGRIARVAAPKLFLHGPLDTAIPIAFARRLFDHAPGPKTFIEVPEAGHMALWRADAMAAMRAWLAALPKKHS